MISDPVIRRNSDVYLKNSIIILDEAHNVEDACREAASFSFNEKELREALIDFEEHGEFSLFGLVTSRHVPTIDKNLSLTLCLNMNDLSFSLFTAKLTKKSDKTTDEMRTVYDEYLIYYERLIEFTTDLLAWIKFVADKFPTSKSSSSYSSDQSVSTATVSWQNLEASLKDYAPDKESKLLFDNKSSRYQKLTVS